MTRSEASAGRRGRWSLVVGALVGVVLLCDGPGFVTGPMRAAAAGSSNAVTSNDGTTASGTLGSATVGATWTATLHSAAGYHPDGLLAVASGGSRGIELLSDAPDVRGVQVKAVDTTPKVSPDAFSASVAVTPDADTVITSFALSQSANRLDVGTFVLSWSGGGLARLADPADQISNLADDTYFASGQALTVSAATVFADSMWRVELPGANVTYSYSYSGATDSDVEGFRVKATLTAASPPITVPPTTVSPTTVSPTTTVSSTTTSPTTTSPTTTSPTTTSPTTEPPLAEPSTTVQPTTVQPTTVQPTTVQPTTVPPTTGAAALLPATGADTNLLAAASTATGAGAGLILLLELAAVRRRRSSR